VAWIPGYNSAMHRLLVAAILLLGGCPDESPTRDSAGPDLPWPDGAGLDARRTEARTGDRATVDGIKPKADSPVGAVVPPLGGSSGGSGGPMATGGQTMSAGGVSYIVIVPSSYSASKPSRAMLVFSGTEGGSQMASNLKNLASAYSLGDVIFAVLDGVTYNGNGQAGATVLDELRKLYNIDNDRTYLLSESAGTTAGLQLGFTLRQSYFAAYWVNDINASASPKQNAAALGFAPWGNVGPGGDLTDANAVVSAMKTAGYRLPTPAPYDGAGSTQHGSTQQFMAALSFYSGKSR
jgi:hypothetical protein